jgi:hypothetical protein
MIVDGIVILDVVKCSRIQMAKLRIRGAPIVVMCAGRIF